MKKTICEAINLLTIIDIVKVENDGDVVEVKTSISPYLQFELEKKINDLFQITDIWFLEEEKDPVLIYCGDLPSWQRGSKVELIFSSNSVGTMKRK